MVLGSPIFITIFDGRREPNITIDLRTGIVGDMREFLKALGLSSEDAASCKSVNYPCLKARASWIVIDPTYSG